MKNKILKILSILTVVFALNFGTIQNVQAQCPMCKMSAESNLRNGGSAGNGLNKGILYMFTMPYLLVGVIGFIWYRNRKKEEEEEAVFDPRNN